ncbi:MAG: type I-D CRISPR-associated protein Cas10d/Csc3 [Abditibacteriales bacterium]|nr:type I-D CRISPR-associated protein Cas10d/Csc3 [Abditibacteriales bacterium]
MNRRGIDSMQRQKRKAYSEEEMNRLLEDIAARLRGEPPSEGTLQQIYQQLVAEGKLDLEQLRRSWENLAERLRSLQESQEQEAEEPPQAVREQHEDYRRDMPTEVRTLKDILTNFLSIALPRMLDRGYALKPAKSEGYEHGRHEAAYYVDQSIRTHVLNGLFAVTRLLGYLTREGIATLSDSDFRRLLALFATHDLHKDEGVEKGARGEFDIALPDIEEEMRALGIPDFVATTPAEHRLAMIHTPSPKVGDLSTSDVPPDTSRLISWVRLADALASMQSAQECRRSAQNRLNEVLSRQLRTNPQAGRRFYFHELDDYRGLSTLLIHRATTAVLEKRYGLFPLLFFPNGVLYVGAAQIKFDDPEVLRKEIAEALLTSIQESLDPKARTIAAGAIRPAQSVKVDKYAYLFTDRKSLLQALADFASRKGEKTVLTRRFSDRLSRQLSRAPTKNELGRALNGFCKTYDINLQDEQDPVFSENWACVWKFAEGVESIAKALVGEKRALCWLFARFHTPPAIRQSIRDNLKDLTAGLVADHCLVIAYHYLCSGRFGSRKQPANQVEASVILNELVHQLDAALQDFDTAERRLDYVNDELGLQSDIARYLSGHLSFSFAFDRGVSVTLPLYSKERSRSHARLCVICRREIPSEMGDRIIKTSIAEQNALVFSNFVLPAEKVKGQMVWCPMCYLEFMLRKLMGLGYAEGADAGDRLYLYLLPDYSFTPDFWEFAENILEPFAQVTTLKLRQLGADDSPSLPRLWIEHGGQVDQEMMKRALSLFCREAERLGQTNEKTSRLRREEPGERLHMPKIENPNYLLLTYEKSAYKPRRGQPDLSPTRSELWAKAAYAGCLLHLLLGVRVYITDKPYLPMSRPDEMTAVVQLDAPHPVLRGILGGKTSVSLADLQAGVIDVLSAAWEVNAALAGGSGNLDKQVAGVLERLNTSPLAGATFYKERERDDRPVYDIFTQGCDILLRKKGGETMELVEQLTERSLDLFLPLTRREGKAHRYETVFRTAVEVVKRNPKVSDEELIARVGGAIVKRLERVSGGAVPLHGEELNAAALAFARLVVKDLFRERCKGSAARLTHEENALADAIYFLTDQKIRQRWETYKAKQAASGEPVEGVEEATVVG